MPCVIGTDTGAQAVDAPWFAIWTRSRHEQLVRDQLACKGVEVFLPTLPRWSRWKDRTKRIDWPLFPGYCFARFAPASRLDIVNCVGAVSIVSFDGRLPLSLISRSRVFADWSTAIFSMILALSSVRAPWWK